MPIVTQLWDTFDHSYNAQGVIQSATYKYLVEGVDSEKDAIFAVLDSDEVPKGLDGGLVTITNIEIEERVNETVYKVNVNYGKENNNSSSDDGDEEPTMSFDCSGGTSTITIAKWQKELKKGSKNPGLAIGWNGKVGDDSDIKGVEIVIPSCRETLTKVISRNKAESTSFKRKIAEYTGKVNSKKFKGWNEGEVLFLGASFTADKSKDKTVVTYNFLIRFNGEDTIGGKKYDKFGHEYLWSIPKTTNSKENSTPTIEDDGVYLARVYDYVDLNNLGI